LGTAGRWFESSCPDHFLNCDLEFSSRSQHRAFRDTMKKPNSARLLDYLDLGPKAVVAALLLALFLAVNCMSMTRVLATGLPGHPNFWSAVGATLLLAALIPLFALARFSFGYIVGVAFYSLIAGFIWLTYFVGPAYDDVRARWSAAASLLLFLLPVLFQTARLPPAIVLSLMTMNRLLVLALGIAIAVLVWNSYYGFALVGIQEADQLRTAFERPTLLRYLTPALIGAVLPFAFAYFACQRRYIMAACSILLIVGFYPVLLNKTVLFAVVWLPFLFLLFRKFEPKRAAILALLIPMTVGLIGNIAAPSSEATFYLYGLTNRRMFAYPAIALDRYSDFFSSHELTHFCQISLIRAIRGCPYAYQLGAEMAERYHMGSLNASLFATEGIASVGPVWAPVSALVCGLILSVANSISARLSPALIAASSGLVVQALINVPLSAAFLSNGLFVLLLLWAVSPDPMVDGEGR
jgi:hypothetical protein